MKSFNEMFQKIKDYLWEVWLYDMFAIITYIDVINVKVGVLYDVTAYINGDDE